MRELDNVGLTAAAAERLKEHAREAFADILPFSSPYFRLTLGEESHSHIEATLSEDFSEICDDERVVWGLDEEQWENHLQNLESYLERGETPPVLNALRKPLIVADENTAEKIKLGGRLHYQPDRGFYIHCYRPPSATTSFVTPIAVGIIGEIRRLTHG